MANPGDEPIWAADRLVAPTPDPAIIIPATANEFAIKAFVDEGSSNFDTDKIMARMDAMTIKMDVEYKDMKSCTECNSYRDLKTKLEATTKNHQASIQNLEEKFDKLANKQSGRPSRSLSSNIQPNLRGSSSKPYQPPQARNEHVDDEDEEPIPQPQTPKPNKEAVGLW
ncbi:hypothetical protein Tco_0127848 [Tanacetum coccineum]